MDSYNNRWVTWVSGRTHYAITIGCITYYSCDKSQVSEKWHKHEDEHKRQWRRGWYIGFLTKYIYYHIKYGYWNNPYEVLARKASL